MSRPRRRKTYRQNASISPETGISITIKQAGAAIAGILIMGSGWFYLAMGQAATIKDVADIKSVQTATTTTTGAVMAAQDEKRAALAKDFLDSNARIEKSIATLTTLLAVQSERQNAQAEKLDKVIGQVGTALQNLNVIPSARR